MKGVPAVFVLLQQNFLVTVCNCVDILFKEEVDFLVKLSVLSARLIRMERCGDKFALTNVCGLQPKLFFH